MRLSASPFYQTLTFRALVPIVVFGIAFGVLLIGSVRFVVMEFVDQQATNDLRWRSSGMLHMIDSNLDELQRTGRRSDIVALRHRKVTALIQIEDYARDNNIEVIVRDTVTQRIHRMGIKIAAVAGNAGPFDTVTRFFTPEFRRYSVVSRFEPWQWDITAVQDNRAYTALLNRLMWSA